SAAGRLSRKNVSRWAVFGPMPGRRWRASIRRATGSGEYANRARLHAETGDLEAAGQLAELLLHELARFSERLVRRREHQILEHLHVVLVDDLRIDLDGRELLLAVGLDRHHAAAGGGVDFALADLFLHRRHLRLQLLRFLHDVPEALHWPSPSGRRGRTATTSP